MNRNLIGKIKSLQLLARKVDYARMQRFAVARHEDALSILMEVASDIEKLAQIWFPNGIIWHTVRTNQLVNPLTGIRVSYVNEKKKVAWVWLKGGIEFLFNLSLNKCLFVTRRKDAVDMSEDAYSFKHYRFIKQVDDDTYSRGIECLVKSPSVETYFPGVNLELLSEYKSLLDCVNEDYEMAVNCRELLDTTLEGIEKNEEAYLDMKNGIEAMMDSAEEKPRKKGKTK